MDDSVVPIELTILRLCLELETDSELLLVNINCAYTEGRQSPSGVKSEFSHQVIRGLDDSGSLSFTCLVNPDELTLANANKESCETYVLDGGLVGRD